VLQNIKINELIWKYMAFVVSYILQCTSIIVILETCSTSIHCQTVPWRRH